MKPHVTVHMITSVDGRIRTSRWSPFEGRGEYEKVHDLLDGDAWMCGRVTMSGTTWGCSSASRRKACPVARSCVSQSSPSSRISSWARTVSATPSSRAARLSAYRYNAIGSRPSSWPSRRIVRASSPSASTRASATSSTRSRVSRARPRDVAGVTSMSVLRRVVRIYGVESTT